MFIEYLLRTQHCARFLTPQCDYRLLNSLAFASLIFAPCNTRFWEIMRDSILVKGDKTEIGNMIAALGKPIPWEQCKTLIYKIIKLQPSFPLSGSSPKYHRRAEWGETWGQAPPSLLWRSTRSCPAHTVPDRLTLYLENNLPPRMSWWISQELVCHDRTQDSGGPRGPFQVAASAEHS